MSSQNTTHATDTLAMNTPNATTAEVVQSANAMMDMWGAENIAKVRFAAENFSHILAANKSVTEITRHTNDYVCLRFTLNFLRRSCAG